MSNTPDSSKGPGRRTFLRGSAATLTALSYSRAAARAAGSEPSDTIRVAISGCGQVSTYALIPSLRRMKGVSITALCDVWPYRLTATQRTVTDGKGLVQGFGNMDEMLEKAGKDFDAVVVATPCWMHAPQTRKALEAGKHVYCEKTMSNTVDAARDMVRAQRQTGKLLQIGHQRRSNPRSLGKSLTSPRIGIAVSRCQCCPAWQGKTWMP
jgi:Oxidoreductase family, NAD-binding Rossmann fold